MIIDDTKGYEQKNTSIPGLKFLDLSNNNISEKIPYELRQWPAIEVSQSSCHLVQVWSKRSRVIMLPYRYTQRELCSVDIYGVKRGGMMSIYLQSRRVYLRKFGQLNVDLKSRFFIKVCSQININGAGGNVQEMKGEI